MYSEAVHAPDRPTDNHREAGLVRSPSHETHTVVSEATLAHARESGKGHSVAPLSPSTPRLVVKRGQCTSGPTIAPPSTRSSKVYRRLKLRLGRTLRGLHCKRHLVSYRKLPLHQLFGVKNSLPGPQEFRASLQGPDCIDNNGQHNCSLFHQQGGRYEIRLSLCPPLETSVLVSPQRNDSEVSAHSRLFECNRRQAVQTQPSDQTELSISGAQDGPGHM